MADDKTTTTAADKAKADEAAAKPAPAEMSRPRGVRVVRVAEGYAVQAVIGGRYQDVHMAGFDEARAADAAEQYARHLSSVEGHPYEVVGG